MAARVEMRAEARAGQKRGSKRGGRAGQAALVQGSLVHRPERHLLPQCCNYDVHDLP